ncbi:MAG: hypothetical protein AAB899_02655 [Patescibacteria group bacterium]
MSKDKYEVKRTESIFGEKVTVTNKETGESASARSGYGHKDLLQTAKDRLRANEDD